MIKINFQELREQYLGTGWTEEGWNNYKKAADEIIKNGKKPQENNRNQNTKNESEGDDKMAQESEGTKKIKVEKNQKEYIDLVLKFMQMTFDKQIKGFEVKNAASGKIKIIIK